MANRFDARQFQACLERLDALLREAEGQAHSRALVQAVLDLHAAGLERLLDHLRSAGEAGAEVLDACAHDDLVAGLLLLHGLHPLDLQTRVQQALEGVRPYLRSHGGNVELTGIRDGVVTLRLHGSCHSCPSSSVTMQQTIEEAIYGKAPEVAAVEVEAPAERALLPENGRTRVALPMV
jgi:Fe-S cluster biogenesis protein NfuA